MRNKREDCIYSKLSLDLIEQSDSMAPNSSNVCMNRSQIQFRTVSITPVQVDTSPGTNLCLPVLPLPVSRHVRITTKRRLSREIIDKIFSPSYTTSSNQYYRKVVDIFKSAF